MEPTANHLIWELHCWHDVWTLYRLVVQQWKSSNAPPVCRAPFFFHIQGICSKSWAMVDINETSLQGEYIVCVFFNQFYHQTVNNTHYTNWRFTGPLMRLWKYRFCNVMLTEELQQSCENLACWSSHQQQKQSDKTKRLTTAKVTLSFNPHRIFFLNNDNTLITSLLNLRIQILLSQK